MKTLTQYEFALNSTPGGKVSANPDRSWLDSGTYVSLRAYPSENYQFAGWFIDGRLVSNSTNYTVLINGPVRISAQFVEGGPSAALQLLHMLMIAVIAIAVIAVVAAIALRLRAKRI